MVMDFKVGDGGSPEVFTTIGEVMSIGKKQQLIAVIDTNGLFFDPGSMVALNAVHSPGLLGKGKINCSWWLDNDYFDLFSIAQANGLYAGVKLPTEAEMTVEKVTELAVQVWLKVEKNGVVDEGCIAIEWHMGTGKFYVRHVPIFHRKDLKDDSKRTGKKV